jgi:two-component system chemotaxis family response regulator WspR
MSPVTAAEYLGKKLCRTIEALEIPHSGSSVGKHLTVSIGVAGMVPTFGESYNLLVDSADKALYEAKKTGRNRVVASS